MEQITPQQRKQILVWVEERDNLLSELSNLRTEKESALKHNEALGQSNLEIEGRINIGLGRLEEITKKEEESCKNISKELADLIDQKSSLQTEITNLEKIVIMHSSHINTLKQTIEMLTLVHDKVFDRTNALEQVVDYVKKISDENLNKADKMFHLLKKSIQELININTKNVNETNDVIQKIPGIILEYRKPDRTIITPILNKKRLR